jgi:hypothetical protein
MVGQVSQAARASQRPPSRDEQVSATDATAYSKASATKVATSTRGKRKQKRVAAHLDMLGCVLATMVAWGATALPPGDFVRVLLTLPIILFVPGYLALQAVVGRSFARDQRRQAMAAFGLSPALVGLVALATAIIPGGFQLGVIANAILVTCILLAAGAIARRILDADRAVKQRVLVPAAADEQAARPSTDAGHTRRAAERPLIPPAVAGGAVARAGATGTHATTSLPTQGGVEFVAIRPGTSPPQANNADAGDTSAGNRQP